MTMRQQSLHGPSTGMLATVWAVLRVVLAALAGVVLTLSALVLGVVVGAGVLLWQRLGGRAVRVPRSGWRGARARSRPSASHGDVIDVEVRELAPRQDDRSGT